MARDVVDHHVFDDTDTIDEIWEAVARRWPGEYRDEWQSVVGMVGGEPTFLLNSREVIRARWPGLLGPTPPHILPPKPSLWKRVRRAWYVLQGI